jgi:hypothetical protein
MTYTKSWCELYKCTSYSSDQGICFICQTIHQNHFCVNHSVLTGDKLVCEKCKTTWVKERSDQK